MARPPFPEFLLIHIDDVHLPSRLILKWNYFSLQLQQIMISNDQEVDIAVRLLFMCREGPEEVGLFSPRYALNKLRAVFPNPR